MSVDPAQWRSFRRGELSPDARRATLRAVLTDPMFEDALNAPAPAPPRAEDYGDAFDRGVAAAFARHASRTQDAVTVAESAERLEARLGSESSDALAREVADRPAVWRRRLAKHLRRRSRAVGFEDAGVAIALARLAVAVLDVTVGSLGVEAATGEDIRAREQHRRAQARAWAQLGNALRIGSDLRAADDALGKALGFVESDLDPPEHRAAILSLTASLRSDQSRFDEAVALCKEAARLAKRARQDGLYARVQLILASQYAYRSELDQAIEVLVDVQAHLDPGEDSRLALVASHNSASYLNEARRPVEAWAQLRHVRRHAEAIGNDLDLLRLRWLEGRVLLAMKRVEEGLAALHEAGAAFLERDMAYEMAQISLELAAHHAERGAHAEVRRLAGKLVPVFAARDVHREARAALEVFVDAVRNETIERDLINRVSAYLEHARDRPRVPFRRTET